MTSWPSRSRLDDLVSGARDRWATEHFERGWAAYMTNDHSVALAYFNAALELEPNNPTILGNRGSVLNALGHYARPRTP